MKEIKCPWCGDTFIRDYYVVMHVPCPYYSPKR